jgi:hypothetical protein
MSARVEDRLRDYTLRIDDAIDEYAARARTRTVPTAFLESPKPTRRPAGGGRLVAAIAVCVIACATAGVVIAQRDPGSRPTRPASHRPAPSPTTTIGLHTVDGKTFGPMPNFGPGKLTLKDYAEIPDYVSVAPRVGVGIAGYVKKSDLYPIVNGQILPGGPIMPVYADGGSPLVGHFYQCKGFVALTEDAAIPCRGGTTTSTAPPLPTRGALDLENGTLFGFKPGPLTPATVLAALTPELGPPTRDTGWYVTKSNNPDDCIGGQTQRILRWGNVSYAFWRVSDPTQYVLWSWTLGDSRAADWGDRHEPLPIVEQPVINATTAAGLGVGTSTDTLRSVFGSRFVIPSDGSSAQIFRPDQNPTAYVRLVNGKATGIAGVLPFC